MEEYIQAIVTILALVNPLMCVTIFSNCVHDLPQKQKTGEALKAIAFIGAVLFASSIFGTRILGAFGVSLAAFSCAGGVILAWIGIDMLRPGKRDPADRQHEKNAPVSLSPLILFAASPGTVTAVITIATAHQGYAFPVTALTGVAVSVAILAAALLLSVKFSSGQRKKGQMRKMVSSYMAVLIIAMGIQFLLKGANDFLNG